MSKESQSKALEEFISNTVALNSGRVERIEKAIGVVTGLLENNEPFDGFGTSLSPQGSYKHGTAIKPVGSDDDYDVDLLMEMDLVADWEPKEYLSNLHDFFYGMDRYKDIVDKRGKTRCVTLDYADDFHVDIVPCVSIGSQKYIANKKDNSWEVTDGDGYATWFLSKDEKANGHLAEVVQMSKYLRDYKNTFSVKSVVLTTLLGMQVSDSDSAADYVDLATTLGVLFSRLDAYLQQNEQMPTINNPALGSESFTERHWTQDQYLNFRKMINYYSAKVIDALQDADDESFKEKMSGIFGDSFSVDKSLLAGTAIDRSALGLASDTHRIEPSWGVFLKAGASVDITAELYGRNDKKERNIESGRFTSYPEQHIVFTANVRGVYGSYEVFWQVVNTGSHAASEQGGLRGQDFFTGHNLDGTHCSNPLQNVESIKYNGTHYIECFVVQDGYLVVRSGPFYVRVYNPRWQRFKKPRRR